MADIKQDCNELRAQIQALADAVKGLKRHDTDAVTFTNYPAPDAGEMQANIMLAYRHLEDARMCLGKVIQAIEGGVSIFDKA